MAYNILSIAFMMRKSGRVAECVCLENRSTPRVPWVRILPLPFLFWHPLVYLSPITTNYLSWPSWYPVFCLFILQPCTSVVRSGNSTTFNLETAVRDDKVTQSFEPLSLPIGGAFTFWEWSPPIGSDSDSKSCISLSSRIAVSRFKNISGNS